MNNSVYAKANSADLADIVKQTVPHDLSPIVLDMHNDVFFGYGWLNTENGTYLTKNITQNTNAGDSWAYCDISGFVSTQLIILLGDDGKYYTNRISYIDTGNNRLGMECALPCNLKTGTSKVFNTFENFAHTRAEGLYAIADYAMREMLNFQGSLFKREYARNFTDVGSVTKTDANISSYGITGGEQLSVNVTGATIGDGIKYAFTISEYSKYWKVKANVTGVYRNRVKVQLFNVTTSAVVSEKAVNTLSNFYVEFNQFLTPGDYEVRILSTYDGAVTFTAFYVEIYKYDYLPMDMDYKTHLFLGDSWFQSGAFMNRIATYLPNANMINYGVGGNAIQNLINRFTGIATAADKTGSSLSDADFTARSDATLIDKIDYVWIMCGTNDYCANMTSVAFKAKMRELILDIISRGAKPIIFTSSVGDAYKNGGTITYAITSLSKQYADFYV